MGSIVCMLKNIQQNVSQCCQSPACRMGGGYFLYIFLAGSSVLATLLMPPILHFFRDVWIRTHAESCRSKQVRYQLIHPSLLALPTISLNLATHRPELSHPSSLTQPPITLNQPPVSLNQPPISLYQPHHLPSQRPTVGRWRLPYGKDMEQGIRDKPRTSPIAGKELGIGGYRERQLCWERAGR